MKCLIIVILSLTLMACGGGSGGGSTDTTTPTDPVVVIPTDHCSDNNTYREYLGTRTYVFENNECNDLWSVDFSYQTGHIDTVKFTDSTTIIYAQGMGNSTLEAGDIYSIKWLNEDENQVSYQWDENLQCFNVSTGEVICKGDERVDQLLTYYAYAFVMIDYNTAMKEAVRIK